MTWTRRIGALALAALLAVAPAEAASLLPNGEQVFLDNNGDPLAAGTVGFYIPNTLTPKTTWQDAAQTIPNTNPVVLDAGGRAIIYGSGVYRQIVKDQFGNLIWDQLTTGLGSGGLIINSTITGSASVATCSGVFPINNGTSAPITITLPASPANGDSCLFFDIGNNAGTYPITLSFGSNFDTSGSHSFVLNVSTEEVGMTWFSSPSRWAEQ